MDNAAPVTVCGIDPSLTGTGIAIGSNPDNVTTHVVTSAPRGSLLVDRMNRYSSLVGRILDVVEVAKPAVIFIEAYAFSRNGAGQNSLVEFGSLLRWHLLDITPRVLEVSPTSVKKFATDIGNAKKEIVASHITKRYGVTLNTSDEFDAFALAQMALVSLGHVSTKPPEFQRKAVDSVLKSNQISAAELLPGEAPF